MNDFNLDNDNNLQIMNGDFLVRDCSNQDAKLILIYHPGHLKSDPQLGVGIDNMILGQLSPLIKKTITEQLGNDGYKLKDLYFDDQGVLQVLV